MAARSTVHQIRAGKSMAVLLRTPADQSAADRVERAPPMMGRQEFDVPRHGQERSAS
jgi:hypothetical protein